MGNIKEQSRGQNIEGLNVGQNTKSNLSHIKAMKTGIARYASLYWMNIWFEQSVSLVITCFMSLDWLHSNQLRGRGDCNWNWL